PRVCPYTTLFRSRAAAEMPAAQKARRFMLSASRIALPRRRARIAVRLTRVGSTRCYSRSVADTIRETIVMSKRSQRCQYLVPGGRPAEEEVDARERALAELRWASRACGSLCRGDAMRLRQADGSVCAEPRRRRYSASYSRL